MILGSFTLSLQGGAAPVTERIVNATAYGELVFHRVTLGAFDGGYYLHPRLPSGQRDIYYLDKGSDIMVLLSGAVYNRHELSRMYDDVGEADLDPHLVAVMFLREGPGFVEKLNGDFAIFILRPAGREVFLFRDHVGVMPLAYTVDGQTLSFSSDIAGLSRAVSAGRAPDIEFLLSYFRFTDRRRAPDGRVSKLLPGHFLRFSAEGTVVTEYWKPGRISIDHRLQHRQMLSDLTAIVHDAVRIRCDHRYTAGAHVSSGIDSGIVSVLARREYSQQERFYGFSWSPADFAAGDTEYDERDIVTTSCDRTGIVPLFSDMSAAVFPMVVSSYDENRAHFSEDRNLAQAVEAGVNLIFSGWGGDEFISTGDRGIETDLLRGLHLRTFFRRSRINRPGLFIRDLLFYVVCPALGVLDRGTARSFRHDARYIRKAYRRNDREALKNFYFHTSRHQMHLRMLQSYHIQERCEVWAVSGYHRGVEYRYPLLDRRIIEYMLKVPSMLLCMTDHFRPLLRETGEGVLPGEVRWNWSKTDPVYRAFMSELFREAADSFMEEVHAWKENPDLYFVDFDLLTEDIKRYKEHPDAVETKVLFRTLVYIKGIHEFSKKYREFHEFERI
jgi:asparagine synthase (glutamine-hydrolysing)